MGTRVRKKYWPSELALSIDTSSQGTEKYQVVEVTQQAMAPTRLVKASSPSAFWIGLGLSRSPNFITNVTVVYSFRLPE